MDRSSSMMDKINAHFEREGDAAQHAAAILLSNEFILKAIAQQTNRGDPAAYDDISWSLFHEALAKHLAELTRTILRTPAPTPDE